MFSQVPFFHQNNFTPGTFAGDTENNPLLYFVEVIALYSLPFYHLLLVLIKRLPVTQPNSDPKASIDSGFSKYIS